MRSAKIASGLISNHLTRTLNRPQARLIDASDEWQVLQPAANLHSDDPLLSLNFLTKNH